MDDDNPSTSMTSVHFHTHIVSHDECEEGGEGGEEERAAGNVAGGGDDTGGDLGPVDRCVVQFRAELCFRGARVGHESNEIRPARVAFPSITGPHQPTPRISGALVVGAWFAYFKIIVYPLVISLVGSRNVVRRVDGRRFGERDRMCSDGGKDCYEGNKKSVSKLIYRFCPDSSYGHSVTRKSIYGCRTSFETSRVPWRKVVILTSNLRRLKTLGLFYR